MTDDYSDEPKETKRMEIARAQAAAKGCVIVLPAPNELFVDLDSSDGMTIYRTALPRLQKIFPGMTAVERPSPSGRENRYHAVVTLPRAVVSDEERILLQLLLGSDSVRETISYERVKRGAQAPVMFFEKVK